MAAGRRWRKLAALLALGLSGGVAAGGAAQDDVTVVHAGQLLATPGEAPSGPHTVVVRGERIERVEPGLQPASGFGDGATLVDLSDRFVLPGLVDLHVHLAIIMQADEQTATSAPRLALAAAGYGHRLLQAGVTTVRDAGDNSGVTLALRDAFANGDLPGPRVFAAGRVVSRSGGHGAKRARPFEIPYEPAACDGIESCRRAVRGNIEAGSDWIKLTVSGSGREVTGHAGSAPIMFEDEVAAASAAALQAQRPLAAHAHGTAAINLALRHGVRTIEHGTYFDDSSAALFKRHGAWLVPTAYIARFVATQLQQFGGGPDGRGADDLQRWTEAAMQVPGRAWRAGIPLAVGTDGGPSFPPDATAQEVGLYVDAGVPPAEAIRAATRNGAAALGQEHQLGRIAAGFLADLIAVEGSPLDDPARLRRVVFVMKGGRTYRWCTDRPSAYCPALDAAGTAPGQ